MIVDVIRSGTLVLNFEFEQWVDKLTYVLAAELRLLERRSSYRQTSFTGVQSEWAFDGAALLRLQHVQ